MDPEMVLGTTMTTIYPCSSHGGLTRFGALWRPKALPGLQVYVQHADMLLGHGVFQMVKGWSDGHWNYSLINWSISVILYSGLMSNII